MLARAAAKTSCPKSLSSVKRRRRCVRAASTTAVFGSARKIGYCDDIVTGYAQRVNHGEIATLIRQEPHRDAISVLSRQQNRLFVSK